MPQIKVHEKALAHLTRGLYRSPASALRELISNAWDANASVVRLDTNYPNFYQLSIEDNGDGFTKDEFQELMDGGIGNSQKRPLNKLLVNDRPVIGRLGIGMLGIAQICGGFTITSYPKLGIGFRATVRLYDLLKERLDSNDSELITKTQDDGPVPEVHVGTYEFEDFQPQDSKHGTLVVADDLHPTFIKAFRDSVRIDGFKPPSKDWKKLVAATGKVHSLQELGDYWRLLWELAAACPVPYISAEALPFRVIAEDQKRLISYGFSVVIDGLLLHKPVYLSGNSGGYTVNKLPETTFNIYDRTLKFHGYIVVQEGTSLKPDELRGIMIRIKNVGIGYYDPSMLDYRFNEGPRSRWLTGEIYVDSGLEDALNIDRDSFNRFHPQFRAIQEFVHGILRSEVFPAVYKQIDVRSKKKAVVRSKERKAHLMTVVSHAVGKPVKVTEGETQVATIRENPRGFEVTAPSPESLAIKKNQRDLASAILTIYEIAQTERTAGKAREKFSELLLELLGGW